MGRSENGSRRDAAAGGGEGPWIGGRFRLDFAAPIPHLNTPSARAYAVAGRENAEARRFALVADPMLPARIEALERLEGGAVATVMVPVAAGAVLPPNAERHTLAVVYQRPEGGTLADYVNNMPAGLSEYELAPRLIKPVAQALHALASKSVTHRAIRPDNIYFMDVAGGEVALGDCLAAPPGYDQPVLFEPIERAMAERAGRGDGGTAEDIYALGVTLALVVLKRNSLAELDGEAIVSLKMAKGSYEAICSRQRVPLSLIEPLRGMLCDDPDQRWGLLELDGWLDGRRLPPPRRAIERVPLCAFSFKNQEYLSLRRLVHAMTRDVVAAASTIRSGDLQAWLDIRLKAPELAAGVAEIASAVNGCGSGLRASDGFLVACAAILLDPQGPIRYRHRAFTLDGLGPLLATACLQKADLQPLAETIALGLPNRWVTQQPAPRAKWNESPALFGRLQAHLESSWPGQGWERCLYELNPALPCQSSLLATLHISHLDALIEALDAVFAETASHAPVSGERQPVDRHVAAFAASRLDRDIAPYLKALASPRPHEAIIAMLGILGRLQRRLGIAALPHLSAWFGSRFAPVIASFHSRSLQKKLEQQLPDLIASGSLTRLHAFVEDAGHRQDENGFVAARASYVAAEQRIRALQSGQDGQSRHWRSVGQSLAATVSLIASGIAAAAILAVYLV